jgi:hypothetical protein
MFLSILNVFFISSDQYYDAKEDLPSQQLSYSHDSQGGGGQGEMKEEAPGE